jgi:hypothetical protein
MLNVVGTVQTDPVSGERYIAATDPSPNLLRYSPVLRPFGLVTRALGGGPLGTQEGVWGWTLSPKPGDPVYELRQAAGLNNIGLLVKVCGKVTTIDPEGAYFYINDGSGLRDGTKTLGVENIGLRVSSDGTQLLTGQWLQLTGISSCFRDGEGKLLRLLRVASSVDIRRQ